MVDSAGAASLAQTQQLIVALERCTILDPACGSGAFPMGCLQKMVALLQKLDPDNTLWRAQLETSASALVVGSEAALREIAEVFERDGGDYARKLFLIQNCLFGVDIQPIAIQIAKLRFFIALAIEQKPNGDASQNFGIRPLPNLETKLVAANTLLGLTSGGDIPITNQTTDDLQRQLSRVRADHFGAGNWNKKKKLRDDDQRLRAALSAELRDIGMDGGAASLLSAWDPYNQNQSAPFFDPQWMFGLKNGFDIVIGNPPYGAKLDADLQKRFRQDYPTLVQFKIDSFALFILIGKKFLKENGACCYIVPNALLNNFFLGALRQDLITNSKITALVNFKESVFEAVVHTMIINFVLGPVSPNHEVRMGFDVKGDFFNFRQSDFAAIENCAFEFRTAEHSGLMKEVWKNAIKLGDVLDLRQTIKTGDDKKFVSAQKKNANSKPILRGRDIGRYSHKWPELYVQYGKHLVCPRDPKIFEQPHILIRETGATITATYEDEGHYIMSSAYCGISHSEFCNLQYLLALINSKLFQFLMYKANFENTGGAFTKAKIYHYDQMPVFKATPEQQQPIVSLVEEILSHKKSNPGADVSELETQIDALVFALYGLTDDEIALVVG